MRIGLCGPSYRLRNITADCERTRNWYPSAVEGLSAPTQAQPKLRYELCPTPGLKQFANLGTSPVRGMTEFGGRFFAVSDRFYEIKSDGSSVGYTFLPVDGNPVYFAANNANQLIICSGGQLWLFPLAPGSIVYHNVPTPISNIQIVDGPTNQDYFVTCTTAPPYSVGTTIAFDSIGTLSILDGQSAPLLDIVSGVIHLQLPRTLLAAYPQTITNIVVTPGATGPTQMTAGTGTDEGVSWTNPNNITGNVSYATTTIPTGGAGDTSPLFGSNFGFAIPTNATIKGIQVTFDRKQSQSGHNIAKTGAVYLCKAGSPVGTPKIGTVYYVNSDVTETWGSSTDLWGTTWTNTDLNNMGFGFLMNVAYDETELSDIVSIKNFQVQVWWTVETSTVVLTFSSTAVFGVGGIVNLDGLTNVPVLNATQQTLTAVAGSTVTIGPIPDIGSSYSGAETGTATGQLVAYNAADTGNVLGDVVSMTTSPVQVAADQGPFSWVGYCDDYFVALISNSQQFQISALGDGTTWDPLDKAQVSEFPENIFGALVDHRQLFFWSQKHYIIYENTGNADFPFEPIPGGFSEMGLNAPATPQQCDQSVFWWGEDQFGRAMAWRANGYQPIRISNHAIEQQVNDFMNVLEAVSFTSQQDGHYFWWTWFPGSDTTLVYDAATGLWHERTLLINGVEHAHLARCHALAFGKHLVGSRIDGKIYEMNPAYYDDDGSPILRSRITPQIENEQLRLFFERVQIYLDGGKAGSGQDPQITLLYSDDGGNTYPVSLQESAGKIGQYSYRILYNRLGQSRARVLQIQCSDSVPWRITDAFADVKQGLN